MCHPAQALISHPARSVIGIDGDRSRGVEAGSPPHFASVLRQVHNLAAPVIRHPDRAVRGIYGYRDGRVEPGCIDARCNLHGTVINGNHSDIDRGGCSVRAVAYCVGEEICAAKVSARSVGYTCAIDGRCAVCGLSNGSYG